MKDRLSSRAGLISKDLNDPEIATSKVGTTSTASTSEVPQDAISQSSTYPKLAREGLGSRPNKGRGKPTRAKRRSLGRYPEVIIGLLLILAGVALSLVISNSSSGEVREEVAVLTLSIQKDEILQNEHLGTVQVGIDTQVGLLSLGVARSLVGQRALVDLSAKSPILMENFSSGSAIPAGQVLAGLRLGVGEYPALHLKAGDRVDILAVVGDSPPTKPLLQQVEVHSVHPLSQDIGADMFVTLIIPEFSEPQLYSAAQNGSIRLFLNPAPIL